MGPSWGPLGALLGPLGALLGPSWALLGPSWGHLGPSWATLGPSWAFLGPSWGQLGPPWGYLGPSWPLSGPTWGRLGPIWGLLGTNLDPIWDRLGAALRTHLVMLDHSSDFVGSLSICDSSLSVLVHAFPTYGDYLSFSCPSIPKTTLSLEASSPRGASAGTRSAYNLLATN